MRKRIFGRRLKRDRNERKALFRSLMISLVLNGRITTSHAKAQAIRGEVDKLITTAKNKDSDSRIMLVAKLANEKAADKIINEIAPKFVQRPGGYTRILRLTPRLKDNAEMVLMSWVEEVKPTSLTQPKRKTLEKAKKVSTKKVRKTVSKTK